MPATKDRPRAGSPSRLMSQTAAAEALGVSRTTVTTLVAKGLLEAEPVDQTQVIVRASVERYLRKQRRLSRQP